MTEHDEQTDRRAKALFDESVDALDAATLSRLNRGRQRALAALDTRPNPWLRWVPAAGMATAALLAVMVLLPGPVQPPAGALPQSVTDMEILLGEDEFEMFEDLEFYTWMDLADENGDVG